SISASRFSSSGVDLPNICSKNASGLPAKSFGRKGIAPPFCGGWATAGLMNSAAVSTTARMAFSPYRDVRFMHIILLTCRRHLHWDFVFQIHGKPDRIGAMLTNAAIVLILALAIRALVRGFD